MALVATCSAGAILQSAPLAYSSGLSQASYSAAPVAYVSAGRSLGGKYEDSYDAYPQYSFSYGVKDAYTGDVKDQQEVRDGDVVKGQYSLLEADGTRRVVDYSADSVHGFNAVVRREGEAKVAAPAIVKTIAAAPAVYSINAAQPVLLKQGYGGNYGYAAPAPVLYKNYGSSGYSSSYSTLERGIAKGYSAPLGAYKQW